MAIGQKLEEARNRKGVSIREAEESTKIRGDYLSAFESSNFKIDLPEVYLRGFIRLYARFLGLDQDSILKDLDLELGKNNSKSVRKSLGSISNLEKNDDANFSKTTDNTNTSVANKNEGSLTKPIILVTTFLTIVVISVVFLAIHFSDDESIEKNQESSEINEVDKITSFSQNEISLGNITDYKLKLSAIGPIRLLIIDDESDQSPKDFKNLENGWSTEVVITKSFRCHCSDLENLRFSINEGREKQIEGKGAGNFKWKP